MRNNFFLINRYITAETSEESLTYENKILINNMIPMILIIALFNTLFFPLYGFEISGVFANSVYLIAVAVLFWVVDRYAKKNSIKTYFIVMLFALFLIFVIIQYYPLVGSIVWTVACAFLVISIGRNDNKLIFPLIITIIVLAVYVNIKYNDNNTMNIVALSFIFLGICAEAYFIKTINTRRVEFIMGQLRKTSAMSQISSQMIDFNICNAENKITIFLDNYSQHFDVDRVGIFLLSSDNTILKYKYEWCAPGVKRALEYVDDIKLSDDEWWLTQIENKKLVISNDISIDSTITPRSRDLMLSLGIKSFMSAPIIVNGSVIGLLVHHTVNKYGNYRNDQENMMSVYANILSEAFSKLKREKEINKLAYYDHLTELPNRFLFYEIIDEAILKAKNSKEKFAVLFIDLDSFKSVNDTIGHEGGDRLLQQFAQILSGKLGRFDFAARFGGDEFVILMSHLNNVEQINDRVASMLEIFNRPIIVNNQEFFISASAGVALYPDDGNDRKTLIKNADLAMYSAKDLGKGQYKFYTYEMKAEIEKEVQIINMLFKAQKNNEFLLYYQPQVNINTKEIIGLEALIRWRNPEFGMISPGIFIPLAEQSGLINSIGQWVLETACRQNKEWQNKGYPPMRMAVNLSIEQFRNPNLVQLILKTLETTDLEAKYLELEITESISIKETKDVAPILTELKEHGITISIDDFGTDYSSLARIKNLPIDRIKMSMEFVHGISVSKKDEAIAVAIITLANNLGLKVIAEGVETEKQLNFLKRRKCDEVQGFYFYGPMTSDQIEDLFCQLSEQ